MNNLVFDLGASSLKIGLFKDNQLKDFETVPLVSTTPENVEEEIINQIKKYDTGQESFQISVPGQVVQNKIVQLPNCEGDWSGICFDKIGNFYLRNDADCATDYLIEEYDVNNGKWISLVLGTGLGTSIVHDGIIIENLDLGLIEFDGIKLESLVGKEVLDRSDFISNLAEIMEYYSRLLRPDGYILSGGSVEKFRLKSDDFHGHEVIIAENSHLIPLLGANMIKCKK